MKLGLKGNEVKIVPYNKEWQHEYLRIKDEILKYTNLKDNQIEHIGSTAIEGIQAKPIIDILLGVEDFRSLDKSILIGLKQIGFHKLDVVRLGEIILAKFSDDTRAEKTHFIHIVTYGKDLWKDLLFFRDYLKNNEEAKDYYTKLKMNYLEKSSIGINEYTNFKEDYVKYIYRKRIN